MHIGHSDTRQLHMSTTWAQHQHAPRLDDFASYILKIGDAAELVELTKKNNGCSMPRMTDFLRSTGREDADVAFDKMSQYLTKRVLYNPPQPSPLSTPCTPSPLANNSPDCPIPRNAIASFYNRLRTERAMQTPSQAGGYHQARLSRHSNERMHDCAGDLLHLFRGGPPPL